ncbi:hypothetical protein SMALB_6200 [Streptomyces malaysiensis]|uniref:Lsr2 family protein n=1 Tax=Streptomyces malaysiensis TaxID=92644 RepID=A0A7X5X7N3_STRMQ|nr:hypothetical protein [Streptomyces malaysiensis]
MAQKIQILLLDDLDPAGGALADETLTFALDGTTYEIDLTSENAKKLRDIFTPVIKAGRLTNDSRRTFNPRAKRPMTETDSTGATYSRHQGGVDPKAARAWAIEQSLSIPERGRLPKEIKTAYNAFTKFGDLRPLEKLREDPKHALNRPIPHQDEEDPGAPEYAASQSDEDAAEAKARTHYRPIKRSARMGDDAKWKRRTGYGNDRTDKIEEWTLVERIATLSEQHLGILGMLAGKRPLSKSGKVSYLKTSDVRLENLEFIEEDLMSPHGWSITPFGLYAYTVRTAG